MELCLPNTVALFMVVTSCDAFLNCLSISRSADFTVYSTDMTVSTQSEDNTIGQGMDTAMDRLWIVLPWGKRKHVRLSSTVLDPSANAYSQQIVRGSQVLTVIPHVEWCLN